MSWYLVIKEAVEILYFLSGVGLLIGLYFAYQQLKLMREEYNTNNKRAAVEKSMEYLNYFATTIIPLNTTYSNGLSKIAHQKYKGPKNDDFRFDQNCSFSSEYIRKFVDASIKSGASNLLNQLEYFSAALMSGLADEELAFIPLAEAYCETIEDLYPTICYTRKKEGTNMFSNVIGLYKIWKDRLDLHDLAKDKTKIDEKMSKISPRSIKSIGKAK